MKIDKHRIKEALEYIKLVNNTPFTEIDWSEFPELSKITEAEIEDFKFTGLSNVHFLLIKGLI